MPHITDSVYLLRNVIENAPFPIAVYTGSELKIELANQAMIKAWGKGDNVIGKNYTEILPELSDQDVFTELRSVLETEKPVHIRNKRLNVLVDGVLKSFYITYSFNPLYDSDGKLYGIMNTGYDVTDLTLARQKTMEAEVKLRLAVESADLGTYETDLWTNQTTTSQKFNEIWGSEHFANREAIISTLHPDFEQVRIDAHNEARKTGKLNYEAKIIHGADSYRWVKINGSIINNENGVATTLLGVVQDITEQKQFTEQLTELVDRRTRDLQRSNEDLMQFAHVVSHDLKEPVRKIKMFSGVLKDEFGSSLEKKGNTYIDKVRNATDRMFSLIDGVLAYSTVNSSGYPTSKIDLNEAVENIKADLELVIHEKKAILIRDELPEIEGAPILINQLFYNLINNALKFSKATEPPRVTILFSVYSKDNADWIEIIVRDNGIGIDPKESHKIFEAFNRLNSKDKYEGTGLGLALCKKIVERHHGSIEVKGKIDEGTDFIVNLPMIQTSAEV